jgi:hypothetical protein
MVWFWSTVIICATQNVYARERGRVFFPEHRLFELQRLPGYGLSLCVLAQLAKRFCDVV